jgi:fibronectin type 3 domain-containing protein
MTTLTKYKAMLRIDNALTGLNQRGRPAARGLSWRAFGLWMAGLAIALLAGCGSGENASSSPAVAVPAAPSGLAVAAGDNEITISWGAVAGATSYNIYRSTTAGVKGAKVGASTSTSYVDATAQNGSAYYYVVTAENAAGEGSPSAQSAAVTPSAPVAVPAAPTGLQATPGDAQVTLSWAAVAGAKSYNVFRSTIAGSQGSKIGSTSTTQYTDSSAVNGTTYFYQVSAVNAVGEGAASAQSAGVTPAVPGTVPVAPTGVNAVAGNGQVNVSWNAVAGAASYNVYRSTTQGVQGAKIGSGTTTGYLDTAVVNGTTYYYRITAVNAVGESGPSTQSAGATPVAQVTVPAAPTGVQAADGLALVNVTWTAVSGATSYKVYRSTTQGQQGSLIGSSTAASFTDATALDGTTYYYVVTASSAAGEGPASAAASVTPATTWTTVKMGGGGYVPGIIYHPTVRNLRYARTDVAGVYRWDHAVSSWTALTDGFGRPDGSFQGGESMAVDPTDPNRVYMTARQAVQYGNGRFYYSTNKGTTWNYVDLPFPVGSNNQGRAIGERLMVDPNLPSTLFYGSRTAGLWKSTNRGLNWSQVTSFSSYVMTTAERDSANGGSPVGVEFVVFDVNVPTSGFTSTGSATQTIYVGVAPDYKNLAGLTSYLYKSTDGGATWSGVPIPAAVTTTIGADAVHIPHLARAADGMLYVPFASSSGPGSSHPSMLYKFDGSTWTQLIASGDGRYYGGIGGLSVHGSGATTKIAFGVSGTWGDGAWVQIAMRSSDGGATWQEFGRSGDANGSLNYHDATGYWGWADDLEIDPFDPNHVSYVLGGGIVSTTEGFSATLPRWKYDVEGIEEMVNLAMAAPPPGAPYVLLSAHGDTGMYVHTSLTTSPTRSPTAQLSGSGGNGTGIDMAWNNPAFIVAVGTFTTSKGVYSTDAGLTWTIFPNVPPIANSTGDESKVAVTADGANIIWAIKGEVPYYSSDRGASWTPTNLPKPAVSYHLAADRKNPQKVYAYDHGGNWWYPSNSARFYYSTNGGRTFTASAQTWGPNGFNVTDLAVNPFVEGDVWLADANNLWHSVNSGMTWTKLTAMATVGQEYTNVHGAIKVALGAPAPGSSQATVYLVGTINGKDAVYRSIDMGATWVRIDDDDHRYGGVSRIVADSSLYGRVFLSGRGMPYNK